jgi:hypothetical protein
MYCFWIVRQYLRPVTAVSICQKSAHGLTLLTRLQILQCMLKCGVCSAHAMLQCYCDTLYISPTLYRAHNPDLTLVYLPHMDYSVQKYGPHDTKHVPGDLKEVQLHCSKPQLFVLTVKLVRTPLLALPQVLLSPAVLLSQQRSYVCCGRL